MGLKLGGVKGAGACLYLRANQVVAWPVQLRGRASNVAVAPEPSQPAAPWHHSQRSI